MHVVTDFRVAGALLIAAGVTLQPAWNPGPFRDGLLEGSRVTLQPPSTGSRAWSVAWPSKRQAGNGGPCAPGPPGSPARRHSNFLCSGPAPLSPPRPYKVLHTPFLLENPFISRYPTSFQLVPSPLKGHPVTHTPGPGVCSALHWAVQKGDKGNGSLGP